jgi:hypothetical protein
LRTRSGQRAAQCVLAPLGLLSLTERPPALTFDLHSSALLQYQTRHVTMRRLSGFLFTPVAASPPAPGGAAIRGSASISKAIFDLPSPIPLGQAAKLHAVPPLFYVRRLLPFPCRRYPPVLTDTSCRSFGVLMALQLPKELTTEQDERLAKQKLEVDDLILREEAEWAASRSELEAAVVAVSERLETLSLRFLYSLIPRLGFFAGQGEARSSDDRGAGPSRSEGLLQPGLAHGAILERRPRAVSNRNGIREGRPG